MRKFTEWLSTFKPNIASYDFYVDFNKVYQGVQKYRIELNILNSLIGSKNIEEDFEKIIKKYPETLKCIPLLLAVRQSEIYAIDKDGEFLYNFNKMNYDIKQYKVFMRKTGLFNLLANHIINNLIDYALGVETGLDTNARKNRGGQAMENLVESFIKETEVEYYKEMRISEIEKIWGIDLSPISNQGKNEKKFDFVVKTESKVFAIETNFYRSGGSKLNETARSYKMLALESKNIDSFTFVWINDGIGWHSARKNLEETFDILNELYNINDLKNGVLNQLFKKNKENSTPPH